MHYKVISRHVLLYFMYCDRVTAQGIGWDADHEVGFFIPLNESGGPAGERLVFWSPYIFIDSALGMVTGREIWGFRKTMGETGMPVNPGDPAHYWTKTTLFQQFGLNSHGELATVLELDGASATGPQHSSLADVMLGIIRTLTSGVSLDGLGLLLNFLEGGGAMRLVNLKQLRAVESSNLAQHQALVEIDPQLDQLISVSVLRGDYRARVTQCASHHVVSDLAATVFRNRAQERRKGGWGSERRYLPVSFVVKHGIENNEELAHAGGERG
ncbi:MAG: hypothetical protein JO266_19010, partial [Acidobacteria bacterium]|nr:hypothetical protein [Acidobacteriota bacterium]